MTSAGEVLCKITPDQAPHVDRARLGALATQIKNGNYGRLTTGVTLTGNARVEANGDVEHGSLISVHPDTPLADARKMMGKVLYARIGVYLLKGKPAGLQTVTQVSNRMNESNVVQLIDDHGEDYGEFDLSHPPGTPWVPLLDNGHSADNFVALLRSTENPDRYAIVVQSNATGPAEKAIAEALKAKPTVSIGEFISSDQATRLTQMATSQNERIAYRFADLMGISKLLDVAMHHREKSSTDRYAAPVMYARHDGMGVYGEARLGADGTVRISNRALDLSVTSGDALPLVHSPFHGVTLLLSRKKGGGVHPTRRGPATLAATPRTDLAPKLGPAEHEDLTRLLHYTDKHEATVTSLIASRIGAVDAKAEAHSAEQVEMAGLDHTLREEFKPFGAIVFP